MQAASPRPPRWPANPAVYFLGPEGTFSHILALKRFGKKADLLPEPDFESVVEKVASAPGSLGLLPVENSSGGTVYDSVDLLIRHRNRLAVIEELALDVRIALLRSPKAPAKEPPKTVYSHFTQLKHHTDWLRSKFPGVKLAPVGSTVIAARKAASDPSAAALASPGAAALYGLRAAARPPGAANPNVTHFYVLSSAPAPLPEDPAPTRTAFVATLPNVCGSLHAFLDPFAKHGVSLTSIVSRPVPGKPQTYIFFVEIEGDARQASVARALKRALSLSETLHILGSFPTGKKFPS